MNRRGAALILALVILSLMLVLGVPFVQSQNLGFTDARRTHLSRALNSYSLGADDLALGILGQVQSNLADNEAFHLGTGLQEITNDRARYQAGAWQIDGQTLREEFGLDVPSHQTVQVSDTGGRIDINALDAQGWALLLEHVLGPDADWDDDEALPADEEGDPNTIGELAEELADANYTTVDDLLEVRTNHSDPNMRQQLTIWEYRQLEPLLTVHPIQPGRRQKSAKEYYDETGTSSTTAERYRPMDIGSFVFAFFGEIAKTDPDGKPSSTPIFLGQQHNIKPF